MKHLLVILFLTVSFRLIAQDPVQLKREGLLNDLKKVFSTDWNLQPIDPAEKLRWDTLFSLPPAVLRLHIISQNTVDFATCYFIVKDSSYKNIIREVMTKYLEQGMKRILVDSNKVDVPILPPSFYQNSDYFVLCLYLQTVTFDQFHSNLTKALNPPLQKVDLKFTDLQLDQKRSDPPPSEASGHRLIPNN